MNSTSCHAEEYYPEDAKMMIRQLAKPTVNWVEGPREINVSFREGGAKVGRRDYMTHLVHSYPAKMFHRIPSVFFDNVALPDGAHIVDPFCGSGTVLLEAAVRGMSSTGIDISPLARLITTVKVTPLVPSELETQLHDVLMEAKRFRSKPRRHPVLDSWLSPAAGSSLHRLARAISGIEEASVRAFFEVAMTSIARGVSLADPFIPPLVRLRQERAEIAGPRYRRALQRSLRIDTASVFQAFSNAAERNIERMRSLYRERVSLGEVSVVSDPSAHGANTGLLSGSADAIVTSPPYCGAQKYVRSTKLELALLGVSPEELRRLERRMLGTDVVRGRGSTLEELTAGLDGLEDMIRRIHKVDPVRARMASDYARYMSDFATECARVLRPGGHALVTLGRSRLCGEVFHADRIFVRECRAAGLEWVSTLIDPIPSRGLLTQRHQSAGRLDHEYIVWLRRAPEFTNDEMVTAP